jgi:zinc transport system ATP-binding protein
MLPWSGTTVLLGILKPDKGEITLIGQNLSGFSQWEKVGYLPQNIGLFNPLFPATAKEVVALGLVPAKKFPKRFTPRDTKSIADSLAQMGMASFQNKLIGELSGGQIQRTLLARAIVNQPELLILDEPVSSVDAETREEFFSYTAHLNKVKKTTIILITHDIAHSGGYAGKLLFIDKRIIFYGNYRQFCGSKEMESQFGGEIQHIICHQH